MTTGEIIILITCIVLGIVNILFLKGAMMVHEGFFRASQRIYWTYNKDRMVRIYYGLVNVFIRSLIRSGDNRIQFPIMLDMDTANIDRRMYPCSTNEMFSFTKIPSFIKTKNIILCKYLDDEDTYVLVSTGPISETKYVNDFKDVFRPITVNLKNYKLVKTHDSYGSYDEAVIGYLVNKDAPSTLQLSTDKETDNKVEEFKSSLSYCKYLLDILRDASVSRNDEVYSRYKKLVDKNIVLPSEEDEIYLEETLRLINDKYGDKLRGILGNINQW